MRRAAWSLVVGLAAATAVAGPPAPEVTTGRIVNGVLTTEHAAVGALLYPANPAIAGLACTGTLVGCRTFLTAAHCVEGASASDFSVFLQHAGFVGVEAIAVHPSYSFPVGDVAVLTLAAPVGGIAPMPIDAVGGQPDGTVGTIVGFGRTGGSSQDYGLKREGLVSLAGCPSGVSDTTSICWEFTSPLEPPGADSNTCNGDSGGPLLVAGGPGTVTAGITSGGTAADCMPSDRSYDARVATYAAYVAAEAGGDLGAASCPSLPQIGTSGAAVSAFAGALDAGTPQATHSVMVPAGATLFRVTMNAVDDGSDFDLYVRAGAPPTTSTFDCSAAASGQFGACEFANPAPGPWYVVIHRFGGAGQYQSTASAFVPFCSAPGNDGLPCDDDDACTTGEACDAGLCVGGTAVGCDDGIPCTLDTCDPDAGCVHVPQHDLCGACAACDASAGCVAGPRPDCRGTTRPAASLLKMKDVSSDTGDLVLWKWTRGQATTLADLGDPTTATDYRLCVYDESGVSPSLAFQAQVPASGVCATGPCWTVTTGGIKYRDPDRTPEGIMKLTLKPGGAGQAKVIAKGRGADLPALPALPLALPARVQLQGGGAACFEARFEAAGVVRSDTALFIGRAE
jgi:hypothetical protein